MAACLDDVLESEEDFGKERSVLRGVAGVLIINTVYFIFHISISGVRRVWRWW